MASLDQREDRAQASPQSCQTAGSAAGADTAAGSIPALASVGGYTAGDECGGGDDDGRSPPVQDTVRMAVVSG